MARVRGGSRSRFGRQGSRRSGRKTQARVTVSCLRDSYDALAIQLYGPVEADPLRRPRQGVVT